MKNIKQRYRQFLQDNFSGLQLKAPLFYSWDYGLRFDLQGEYEAFVDERYFEGVIKRAMAIFETAIAPSDKLFFVLRGYRYRRVKIRPENYAFRQIDRLEKSEICYTIDKFGYDSDKECNVALACLTADRINYKNILSAIGNNDFPSRQPRLGSGRKEVYFLNIDKRLIFNMYDDRGLDIITHGKETLRPIYEKHNDWILDYDREEMEKLFE